MPNRTTKFLSYREEAKKNRIESDDLQSGNYISPGDIVRNERSVFSRFSDWIFNVSKRCVSRCFP
jgi:hypothetical protein